MQTGCFEKAYKFSEKAIINIQKLKLREQTFSENQTLQRNNAYSSQYITNIMHTMFLENLIRCNLSAGNQCAALEKIGELFFLCDEDSRLMSVYSAQLHCLLGLYSLSMNLKEQALSQFNQSLKHTSDTDLWLYNAMNSASCYLVSLKTNPNIKNQLLSLMENLLPEKIQTQSTSLTALSHYFRALKFFLNANYQQAK